MARGRSARGFGAAVLLALAMQGTAVAEAPAQRRDLPEHFEQFNEDFRDLFDHVVERTRARFWSAERLHAVDFQGRAERARADVLQSATLAEAVRKLNDLLGILETSHTAVLTPDDLMYHLMQDVLWEAGDLPGIGIFGTRIGDKDFVDAVLEGSPAAAAGVRVGDEIVAVDGAPFHQIRSFRGRAGGRVTVTLRRHREGPTEDLAIGVVGGSPLAAFAAATVASARIIERDGFKIGYVHLWASVDSSAKALADVLPRLGVGWFKQSALRMPGAPVDGLVIDMRGKIGGFMTIAGRYLELIDPRGPALTWTQGGGFAAPASVRGRTVALIDRGTRSTGELFAHSYRRERQGPLIGTRTAGAVIGGGLYRLPADCLLYVAVSGFGVDGEVLEGKGVAPDLEVDRPIPYADGADPVLDAGVAWLAANLRPRRPDRERDGAVIAP